MLHYVAFQGLVSQQLSQPAVLSQQQTPAPSFPGFRPGTCVIKTLPVNLRLFARSANQTFAEM